MTDTEERAFRAGFRVGFDVSREGFNGECPYAAHAPKFSEADNPLQSLEDEAVTTYARTSQMMSFEEIGLID